jgi:hypothetical protein
MIKQTDFLSKKDSTFIAWICPNLKPRHVNMHETIYWENDELNEVYFLMQGECDYVLPKFQNRSFLKIIEHSYFGTVDFMAALIAKASEHIQDCGVMSVFGREFHQNHSHKHASDGDQDESTLFDGLRRKFTVKAGDNNLISLLTLSKDDIIRMKLEFSKEFVEFFQTSLDQLEKTLQLRLSTMEYCQAKINKSGLAFMSGGKIKLDNK